MKTAVGGASSSLNMNMLDVEELGSGSVKPRLTTPFDVGNFVQTRMAKFEIDPSEANNFLDDDGEEARIDDDEELGVANARAYASTHANARNARPSFEYLNNATFDSFYEIKESEEMKDLFGDGTIKKIIIREGNGRQIPNNCKAYVHYVCTAEGVDEPYDSTVSRGAPYCIDFRSCDMIVGLFLATKSMQISEVAKFWIRYDLAYGELGCPPRIPICTDVFCIVEVLSIVEEEKLNSIPYMTLDQRAAVPFKDIFQCAKDMRKDGNSCYSDGAYWKAVKTYRKAVNILEDYPVICSEDEKQRQDLLYTFYNNLAQCYLKLERPQQACVACHLGIRCIDEKDERLAKLYLRFARAKKQLGHPEVALRLIEQAEKREPMNRDILKEKQLIKEKLQEDRQVTKDLMSRMGGALWGKNSKDSDGNPPSPKETESTSSEVKK